MKKNIFKFVFALSIIAGLQSCQAQKVVVNRQVETPNEGIMLLGTQTADQFKKEPFTSWYQPQYDNYQIDQEALTGLKKEKFNSYQLVVFLGTWCGDSHRDFPRFMKILDATKFPQSKLTIIAVNRKKESPNGEEGIYNISRVPTIIVKKYGKEIGRIVEHTQSGFIEKDLLQILQKDNAEGLLKK